MKTTDSVTEHAISDATLVFDRTPVARLISCAATFASAALFFDYLSLGLDEVDFFPLIGLFILVAGTVVSALLHYGDHFYVGPSGVKYENRWLPFLSNRSRWIQWDEVVEVREIRRKILILLSRDGQRMLVDAIGGYAIARREILKRAPHAVISGTLTRDDRS